MKRFIDKKNMKKFIIISAIIGIGFLGINYTFCYPTQINAYIAANVYSEPANSYFDDDNFYQCVVDAYNSKNGTSYPYTISLDDDDLATLTTLYCVNKNISSVKGLEKMSSLVYLSLYQNQITEIDISNNIELKSLSLFKNKLTELDVSGNEMLETIYLNNNQISELDVSNNILLKNLYLNDNQLAELDVSKNTELIELEANNNQIIEIDLSNNINLEKILIANNQLTQINVSNNAELTELELYNNQLTELDVNKNIKLRKMSIHRNKISNIDISSNVALEYFDASNSQLTKLDLSNNSELKSLYLNVNNLASLDVGKNTLLTTLEASNNEIFELDVSNNTALEKLFVGDNQLTKLDVSKNTELINLAVDSNQLTELDVSKNVNLESLYLAGNKLTELDTSELLNLSFLDLGYWVSYNGGFSGRDNEGNLITNLDLTKNTQLTKLYIGNNLIEEIDLSNNLLLTELRINNNQLTEIDVSNNTKLTLLSISDNPFSEIKYVYKNSEFNLGSNIQIPNNLNWSDPMWTSDDIDVVIVNSDGTLYTGKSGTTNVIGKVNGKYDTTSTVNVVEIISDKYQINEENKYIYVGLDKDVEIIKSNISKSHEEIFLEIVDNKLQVKCDEEVLQEFKIVSISSDTYDLSNSYILSGGNTDLEKINVINGSVVFEDNLIKIKYENEVLQTFYESAFNDQNFYNCVIDAYNLANVDVGYNYSLTDEQLNTITKIHCNGNDKSDEDKIISIKGLEKISSLTDLEIYDHLLTDIDVSNNIELVKLNLSSNQLTELDVSNNKKIETLSVNSNQISQIDISNNITLSYLGIANNQLTSLDISNNTELTSLYVYENELTVLDVSNNTMLTNLDAYSNQLTSLDVSNNIALTRLFVNNNQLTEIKLANNSQLNSLLIYDNPYKETLFIYKENDIVVGNNVQLPEQLNWDNPTWTTKDSSIAVVSSDGILSTLKSGTVNISGTVSGKYTTTSTINVVEITSDKYTIDEENNIIFIKNESISSVKDNINVSHGEVVIDIDEENNKLNVKYGENILKEYKIVSYSSDVYDLSNDYIYIGFNTFDINNIEVINGKGNVTDNKLQIKCGEILLEEFDIVSISVNTIKHISEGNLYVANKTEDEIREDFNVVNAETNIYEDRIEIIRDNIVLDTFKLFSINFSDLKTFEKNVTVPKNISYEEFTNKITFTDGLTYKVFDGDEEFISGIIDKDLILKVYYNENEIDSFNITNEYLLIDESINVDSDNNYFNGIDLNTSVDNILNKIDTTGEVIIKNKDNKVITGTDLIGTGSIVSIKLSKETYEYTVIIHGDVDGDGVLKLSDIMKIANYTYKNKNSLSGVFEIAADFDNNGSYNLQDIMKSAKALYGGK